MRAAIFEKDRPQLSLLDEAIVSASHPASVWALARARVHYPNVIHGTPKRRAHSLMWLRSDEPCASRTRPSPCAEAEPGNSAVGDVGAGPQRRSRVIAVGCALLNPEEYHLFFVVAMSAEDRPAAFLRWGSAPFLISNSISGRHGRGLSTAVHSASFPYLSRRCRSAPLLTMASARSFMPREIAYCSAVWPLSS